MITQHNSNLPVNYNKKRTNRSNSRARPAAVMLAVCHTRARSQPLMLSAPITLLMLLIEKKTLLCSNDYRTEYSEQNNNKQINFRL